MKTISRAAALAALPLALALGACHGDNATDTSDSTVGRKLDNALATTKDDVARAGDKISDKTGNAVASVKNAANDVHLEDAAITTSVKTDILKDPDLSVLKIEVDTKDGVVTLNGLADSEAAKTRAERLASGVKGVKEVRNFLTVKHA